MPGGLLSFGVYQRLGGERDFGKFWQQLGLPTIVAIAALYALVAQRIISQKSWIACSIGLVVIMALAVHFRMLL